MDKQVLTSAKMARKAAIQFANISDEQRNQALQNIANDLVANKEVIFQANKEDISLAEENDIAMPLIKRLSFDEHKLMEVVAGIKSLQNFDDPLANILLERELDKGLDLVRVACPIGVVAIIFESRPDALVQISTLCLKSANAVLLKGGSEAKNTNKALYETIVAAASRAGIPDGWIVLMETRDDVAGILSLDKYIDLIIPRGSNAFVKHIMDNSNIPVMGHADGICHTYVDDSADIAKSVDVCFDAKTQYVAVCNATETLLVHQNIADAFLPKLQIKMKEKDVQLLGCNRTCDIIDIQQCTPDDWGTEYLDYILSIKIVDDMAEAIEHINEYGSGHTDAILTQSDQNADSFTRYVDSASVFVNCSTRFADGFVYGLGAEVGVSTSKIHARGPVGIEGLMTYKYILKGDYHYILPYKDGRKSYTHITK